jgi:hypothetical protein
MEIPDNQEMPMPLTSKELIVLMRCLTAALKWEGLTEEEKEIIRKMTVQHQILHRSPPRLAEISEVGSRAAVYRRTTQDAGNG